MNERSRNPVSRFLSVFSLAVVGTAPFAVFLFVMGLVVTERVIYPTASLASSVVAALFAGWAANGVVGDGKRTDLTKVVTRNLLLGLPPAIASILLASAVARAIWLLGAVLAYTCITATILAVRHRSGEATVSGDGQATVGWLLGAVVGVGLVIFVASLFGLTGA
jgi:hypothetical protein